MTTPCVLRSQLSLVKSININFIVIAIVA